MGIFRKFVNKFKKVVNAGKAVVGSEGVNSYFFYIEEYNTENDARIIFEKQKEHLLNNIDHWTYLSELENLSFSHYDAEGNKISRHVKEGDFVKVNLPKPFPEFWVSVDSLIIMPHIAEINLRPSYDPTERPVRKEVTAHFFDKETINKIIFERNKNKLIAEVKGIGAVVNNAGQEAGEHPILNTTVALGGWGGMQEIQWATFTKNLAKGIWKMP